MSEFGKVPDLADFLPMPFNPFQCNGCGGVYAIALGNRAPRALEMRSWAVQFPFVPLDSKVSRGIRALRLDDTHSVTGMLIKARRGPGTFQFFRRRAMEWKLIMHRYSWHLMQREVIMTTVGRLLAGLIAFWGATAPCIADNSPAVSAPEHERLNAIRKAIGLGNLDSYSVDQTATPALGSVQIATESLTANPVAAKKASRQSAADLLGLDKAVGANPDNVLAYHPEVLLTNSSYFVTSNRIETFGPYTSINNAGTIAFKTAMRRNDGQLGQNLAVIDDFMRLSATLGTRQTAVNRRRSSNRAGDIPEFPRLAYATIAPMDSSYWDSFRR